MARHSQRRRRLVTHTLAILRPGLLPSTRLRASAFFLNLRTYPLTTTIHISGLNIPPRRDVLVPSSGTSRYCGASYSGYPVCTWISLLSWWLTFTQVGLSRYAITHWVTVTNFIPIYVEFQGFGLTLARGLSCWAMCVSYFCNYTAW